MKRSLLLGLATLATAATTLTTVAPAQAEPSTRAEVRLESTVSAQITRIDAALTRVEQSAALRGLDADVRAEVHANINADQSALADLSVEVSTADTLAELRDIATEVASYRTVVYAQALATLHAADELADEVQDYYASIDLGATIRALLGTVVRSLDLTVDGAVELNATSDNGDVREVKADLHAAVHAFAQAND